MPMYFERYMLKYIDFGGEIVVPKNNKNLELIILLEKKITKNMKSPKKHMQVLETYLN